MYREGRPSTGVSYVPQSNGQDPEFFVNPYVRLHHLIHTNMLTRDLLARLTFLLTPYLLQLPIMLSFAFVCVSDGGQDNSKSCRQILMKFLEGWDV